MARSRVRPRNKYTLIAGLMAVAMAAALLGFPGHSGGAVQAGGTQSSLDVVVIPGFAAPVYSGYHGVPAFPDRNPQLSAYHFSQLAASKITAAALAKYDTAILYGIRWADIPATGQAAIDAFATTHKVLIWDADGTGSQSYPNFVHPFADTASGENYAGKPNDSVVSFPSGMNFLASDNSSSPYYLSPTQFDTDGDEINDMNAMTTGTKDWVPALTAANAKIPKGGWALAWSYGVIGNHTGLTVYSGIDADAFTKTKLNPNNAVKELALELQASFRQTPDPSCAPNCVLPTSTPGPTHAVCSFAKPLPKHWVHGRVTVWVKTSVAAGITGQVVTRKGRSVASGKEKGDLIRLRVNTRRLPTNRVSRLKAQVLASGRLACTKSFRLKVDNTRPRVLLLATSRTGHGDLLLLRVSERSSMVIAGRGVPHRRGHLIAAHRTFHIVLPARVRRARLVLRDRAGNRVVRKLVW